MDLRSVLSLLVRSMKCVYSVNSSMTLKPLRCEAEVAAMQAMEKDVRYHQHQTLMVNYFKKNNTQQAVKYIIIKRMSGRWGEKRNNLISLFF